MFGEMSGEGRKIFADGSVYEGSWIAGKPHGHGRVNYGDGSYFGDWVRGEKHGYGEELSCTGSKYQGDYFQGK